MFDLAMEVIAAEGCLQLRCEYDSDLFEPATIAAFLDLYRRLLVLAAEGLDKPLSALDLAGEDRSRLLQWGEGGLAPVSRGTILELFAAQVAARPEALALVAGDGQFSYEQLDRAANRLAHTLLARCPLAANDRVALVAQRDSFLLVGLLAILKTGAAYVPVDPDFPPERVRLMLADSGCRLVLASPSVLADIACTAPILSLNAASATAPATAPDSHSSPDDLAYVIFTSGSTGRPKGAQLLQRNAAAFFSALPGTFGFTPQSRILALTTVSFDIAGLELLGALCCGMTVVLATAAQARDPAQVLALVAAENIQVLQLTPTRLKLLLDEGELSSLASVQTLLVGGEALPRHLADRLACLPDTRTFNVYGPTETTIWSAAQLLAGGPVSLGRALPGERLFVLSAEHHLQPVGAIGEIAIAGDGVGPGYLDQPEKTAERFVLIPALASGPVYLTGDLGRWRPDGSLKFLGRLDDQIKIRGTRVEPGEIEHHLRRENGIDDALVIARKAPDGETELIAYLVSRDPGVRALDTASWRTRLALTLPDPLIPARFTVLEALPQTPNGKIDRRALPNPDLLAHPLPSRAPANPIELAITTAFASVLHQHIGPEDDYFAHGGDSIRALRVVARLREAGYGLALEDLFRWPTPASLALHVRLPGVDKPSSPPLPASSAILDHEEIDELFA
jgi:amino acid adenylation domain-containing protein